MCILTPHSSAQCQKKYTLHPKQNVDYINGVISEAYEIIVATSNFRLKQFYDIQLHSTEQV